MAANIETELLTMLRHVSSLRRAATRQTGFQPISFSGPMPEKGEPDLDGSIADAYVAALRFWAIRAAELIDLDDFQRLCDVAHRKARPFPGDSARFVENLFEGLTLKDGAVVYP